MADGQYKFSIGLDGKQLELDIAQAKKAFDSLVKQAQQAGAKIDNMPNPFEKIGSSAPQIEQATQQFNGLNMATQQLVRELPAASMGFNTFFLAISNNLPIMADQIKQVSAANKQLAAQGKPTTSVIKQIITSLFSWQTALIVGVTALSMYGKEIFAWVKSLFTGKEAVDTLRTANEGLQASIEKNGLGIGKQIGTYEELRRKFVAINNDLAKQEDFVRDNQVAFNELGVAINDILDAEAIFTGRGTDAFLESLRLRAEAMAAQNLAIEQYEKAMIAEGKAAELANKGMASSIRTVTENSVVAQWFGADHYEWNTELTERGELEEAAEAARSLADTYFDMFESARSAASDILERLGVTQSSEETRRAEELAQRKAEAEQKAAEARAEQIANTSARLIADARRAATQAEIDAMEDGIEKTIAQINHNYDLEEQTISKREEELKKLRGGRLTSQEEESFAQLRSANAAERDRNTNAAYAALFAEADAWLEEANLEADEAAEDINDVIAKRTKAWEDYRIKYGSIKEKILATTQRYNRLIADAETEGQRMSLEAERDTLLAQYEVEASDWAKTLVDMTAEQLNTMVEELIAEAEAKEEAYQALDNTTGNDASEYRRQIATLHAQIAALREQLGKASKAVSDDNWAEASTLFRNIGEAATEAADGISEFDEKLGFILKGIAELSSLSIDMIGALKGVKEAFEKTGEAASAMEKASAILAVISVAVKAVGSIFNIMQSNAEATRNATIAAYEYAQALDKISNAALRSTYNTIFGKDKYGEFTTLLNETQSQLQDIAKLRSDIAKTSDNAVYKLGQGASVWANFGGLRGKINEGYAYDEALVADMRSGWQKFWGSGNDNIKYTSLDEFYENGKLNVDKLKAYYDTYKEYLTEEQADLVKSLLDTGEMFEQNMEAVNDYMRDIFGDLGASITDSLVDAFKNGTDAAIAMGDAVADVVEKIAVDMAHAAFIQPLLEQAQQGINALNDQKSEGTLSDEEYMRQLMEITSTLMGNAQATGEDMNAYLEYIRQMADELGIDGVLDSDNKDTTYAKGFQAMSQETGSELNGRFTDIQGQTHRIAEAVEFCRGLQAQQAQHLQSVSSTLASIHNDTSLIAQHTKALGEIRDDISVMRRAMDNGII